MTKIKKIVNVTDAAYIAGLFDGEGSVDFAKRKEKRVRKRNRSPSRKAHWKDAWVYSVRFRDALHVCKILWPYTIVKLHKIEQIIDHYEPDIQDVDDNLVDLALERQKRYGLKND